MNYIMETVNIKKKTGRPKKYLTEEERIEAKKRDKKRWYKRNQDTHVVEYNKRYYQNRKLSNQNYLDIKNLYHSKNSKSNQHQNQMDNNYCADFYQHNISMNQLNEYLKDHEENYEEEDHEDQLVDQLSKVLEAASGNQHYMNLYQSNLPDNQLNQYKQSDKYIRSNRPSRLHRKDIEYIQHNIENKSEPKQIKYKLYQEKKNHQMYKPNNKTNSSQIGGTNKSKQPIDYSNVIYTFAKYS